MTPTSVLDTIAKELVQTGAYKDEQSAMKAMAIEQASKKITEYRRTIKRLQKKYQVADLDEFTHLIQGHASLQQEDDWLEWKAALEMLPVWEKTRHQLMTGED
jgi:hypothetical protein